MALLHVVAQRLAVAVAAVEPDADARRRRRRTPPRSATRRPRAHLDAAAREREHEGLRQVAEQRAEQERPRRHARHAGREAGGEIVADRQQPDQQRHRERIGGEEILDAPHARAQALAHQRPADDARRRRTSAGSRISVGEQREHRAQAEAEGIAAEETDDVARHRQRGDERRRRRRTAARPGCPCRAPRGRSSPRTAGRSARRSRAT